MIKKILKIKHVGRFKNFYTRNNDCSFLENTLIFGYNTHGKSTLTAILRSLKNNNKNHIIGRKTFISDTSEPQEVEIIFSDHIQKSFLNDWHFENMEIFDNDFISKNVFYGDEINIQQQSNLYDILIGEDIKILRDEIKKDKEKQTSLENEKNKLKNKYQWSNYFPLDKFIKFKPNDNAIDEKIKNINATIKQQENITNIKHLLEKTLLKSNFSNFKEIFSNTLDLSVEQSINKHTEKNWKNAKASVDFLNTGVGLLNESNNCVFCGQDLTLVSSLIGDFKKVFSKGYKDLKDLIKNKGDKFIEMDIEKEILLFKNYGLDIDQKFNKEVLLKNKELIGIKIKNKQLDLNLETNFTIDENFILFENEFLKIKNFITEYEKNIKVEDISSLNHELKKLECIKYRFSEEGVIFYQEYKNKEKEIEVLKDLIKTKNEKLTMRVNEIFEKNKENINKSLQFMGANFKLEKFEPRTHMGMKNPHFCDYNFVFDENHPVSTTNRQSQITDEPEHLPHFKNTLSDSDKRMLAFVFFLSKLQNDKDLKNKIIIFDDPFSSFDENRKEKTTILLRDITNINKEKPAQKIILTHEISFLCLCYEKLKNENRTKALKINYSEAEGSKLEICCIEDEFLKDDYFKKLEYIKHAAENNKNVNQALKEVRPCIEHLLKRKYYFCLDKDTLASKSVTTYLDKIGDLCLVKNHILDLNLHQEMHDNNHPVLQLNEPAKIQKLNDFLQLTTKI